ncbi:hypothetical protein NMY22_g5837 [Coprinellus aureogranulatus]|nr:hypothetical protein NMY22_g5837 [Coprinellus aureogranulatus]
MTEQMPNPFLSTPCHSNLHIDPDRTSLNIAGEIQNILNLGHECGSFFRVLPLSVKLQIGGSKDEIWGMWWNSEGTSRNLDATLATMHTAEYRKDSSTKKKKLSGFLSEYESAMRKLQSLTSHTTELNTVVVDPIGILEINMHIWLKEDLLPGVSNLLSYGKDIRDNGPRPAEHPFLPDFQLWNDMAQRVNHWSKKLHSSTASISACCLAAQLDLRNDRDYPYLATF